MTSQEIKRIANRELLKGKSHQQVYEDLKQLIHDREYDLAAIVAELPSLAQRKKFGWLNMLQVGLLGIFIILKTIWAFQFGFENDDTQVTSIMLGLPLAALAILMGVVTWNRKYYLPVILCVIWALLQMLRPLFVYPFEPIVLLELAHLAAMIGLAFFIRTNIGGNYVRSKLEVVDANGARSYKQAVKWLD